MARSMTATVLQVVTRECMACGEPEQTDEGKPIYYLPAQLPRRNSCARCGSRALVPAEIVTLRPIREPDFDWAGDRPHRGRPSKIMLERRRLEREAAG